MKQKIMMVTRIVQPTSSSRHDELDSYNDLSCLMSCASSSTRGADCTSPVARTRDTTTVVATHLPRLRAGSSVVFLLVCLCLSVMCGVVGSSTTVDSTAACLQLFDTHDQGVYVCDNHRDLLDALEAAEMMGRDQCEKAFAGEKWNCSGFSILKAPNITSLATKQAAYVHALSLAAIAHSVAKMCAMGSVASCSCSSRTSPELPDVDEESRYTPGCSDNVAFGIAFATELLHKRHTGEGPIQEIEKKNMAVGARVVQEEDSSPYVCRCIGVSGSCSVQSCQYELPEFSRLADRILSYYNANNSCKATWNNLVGSDSLLILPSGCENQLIYYHESPNYCRRDPSVGARGTLGRECDPHSTGANSCQNLCSSCGYGNTEEVNETETNCWCEFVFCCEIRCNKCQERRRYHVCTQRS